MSKNIKDLIADELKNVDSLSEVSFHRIDENTVHRYKLSVVKGKDQGKDFYLSSKKTVIGRGGVGIPLKDIDVSRLHACFEVQDSGQVLINDLGSTNGTFVNDVRIAEIALKSHDVIQVGATKLTFIIERASDNVGEQ
ncbi:MAG: FHA domain-containing protein [Bdellovibrionales bacterium]|nr:FHA domain-containing protein [Bdellovibrionales bacterium]